MERLLIGSLEANTTQAGKPVIDLYSTDTRLQFPELRLFDLSALASIGLDPNNLPAGRLHHRCWAYFTVSDKTTSRGNPYRDVQYLEPVDQPATATSVDNSAVLAELRIMTAHLSRIAGHLGIDLQPPPTEPQPEAPASPGIPVGEQDPVTSAVVHTLTGEIENGSDTDLIYADGTKAEINDAEQQAFQAFVIAEKKPPASVAALRAWVEATPEQRPAPPVEDFD